MARETTFILDLDAQQIVQASKRATTAARRVDRGMKSAQDSAEELGDQLDLSSAQAMSFSGAAQLAARNTALEFAAAEERLKSVRQEMDEAAVGMTRFGATSTAASNEIERGLDDISDEMDEVTSRVAIMASTTELAGEAMEDAIHDIRREANKVNAFSRITSSMLKSLTITNLLRAAVVTGFGAMAAAVATWQTGIIQSTTALIPIQRRVEGTRRAFEETFGEESPVFDFLEEFRRDVGLSTQSAQEFATKIGALGQRLGLTGGDVDRFTERVLKLTGDVSSFANVPFEDALEAVQEAIQGDIKSLGKYGIQLDKAEVKQRALEASGKDLVDNLTEQELAQARVNEIYEEGGDAIGHLSRNVNSAANNVDRIQAEALEFGDTLGQEWMPRFQEVSSAVLDMIDSWQAWIQLDTTEEINNQIADLEQLELRATDATTTQEQRLEIIRKMTRDYPELLGHLEAHKISNQELAQAVENANEQLRQRRHLVADMQELRPEIESFANQIETLESTRFDILNQIVDLREKALERGIEVTEAQNLQNASAKELLRIRRALNVALGNTGQRMDDLTTILEQEQDLLFGQELLEGELTLQFEAMVGALEAQTQDLQQMIRERIQVNLLRGFDMSEILDRLEQNFRAFDNSERLINRFLDPWRVWLDTRQQLDQMNRFMNTSSDSLLDISKNFGLLEDVTVDEVLKDTGGAANTLQSRLNELEKKIKDINNTQGELTETQKENRREYARQRAEIERTLEKRRKQVKQIKELWKWRQRLQELRNRRQGEEETPFADKDVTGGTLGTMTDQAINQRIQQISRENDLYVTQQQLIRGIRDEVGRLSEAEREYVRTGESGNLMLTRTEQLTQRIGGIAKQQMASGFADVAANIVTGEKNLRSMKDVATEVLQLIIRTLVKTAILNILTPGGGFISSIGSGGTASAATFATNVGTNVATAGGGDSDPTDVSLNAQTEAAIQESQSPNLSAEALDRSINVQPPPMDTNELKSAFQQAVAELPAPRVRIEQFDNELAYHKEVERQIGNE